MANFEIPDDELLEESSAEELSHWKLTAGQAEALEKIRKFSPKSTTGCDVGIVDGHAGSGKALAFDQFVQTPAGPKEIGCLTIGEEIYGSNGKLTQVEGVFPQGMRQAYRVGFRDGSSVECDLDHLWTVWTHKRRRNGSDPITVPLRYVLEHGLRFSGNGPHKFSIPLCAPVVYEEKTLPIHPYLLGILIGDGTSLGKTPTLCLPDSEMEMIELAKVLIPKGMEIRVNRAPSCPQWRLVDPTQKGNRLTTSMRQLGLADHKSPQRFIPQIYLRGSIEQRLALLRGLMDSDGCSERNRIRFCTHSARLAEDVVSLVQSLGGIAISKQDGRGAWNINVKTFQNPFSLKRKAANWRLSWKNPPSRHIVSVEPTRKCEHVCIKVSAQDGLFLTNNFIVTHNTTLIRHLARDAKIFVLCPTGKAAVRVKEVAGCDAMTIHRWLYTPVVSEFGEVESWALNTTDDIQRPANNILLVDEASMVTQTVYEDLLSICTAIGVNIVFIGDSFQLPPVETRKSSFSVFGPETPHAWKVKMTEVLRQAKDSSVLRAATAVREGAPFYEAFSELEIIPPERFNEEVVRLRKSQGFLICHTNKTRQELNIKIRGLFGFTSPWVEPGESLVVTKNNYDLDVYNGEIYAVSDTGSRHTSSVKVANFTNQKERKVSAQYLNLGLNKEVLGCKEQISGELGDSFTDSNFERGFRKWAKTQAFKKGGELPTFLSLAFAYCMTAHKLQGSQTKHGVVVLEKTVKPFGDGRRWVYTALTRSEETVKLFYKEKNA